MQTELNKVIAALRDFYAHETFLFEKDVGERAITHRFAVHLEKQFSGWSVDCNYDRLGERTLHLPHGSIISPSKFARPAITRRWSTTSKSCGR